MDVLDCSDMPILHFYFFSFCVVKQVERVKKSYGLNRIVLGFIDPLLLLLVSL